jgi:hypothetical protein
LPTRTTTLPNGPLPSRFWSGYPVALIGIAFCMGLVKYISKYMLLAKETLNKSPSEMKCKAPGAQEPEHMGYM